MNNNKNVFYEFCLILAIVALAALVFSGIVALTGLVTNGIFR